MEQHNLNNCTCYIYRVKNNDDKFFKNKTLVKFHYDNDTYGDCWAIEKELKKIHGLFGQYDYCYIYFSQIVNNMIICMRSQPDLIYEIMKNFDDSDNYEKALIIKQLYESAQKIRKYEENNPSLNSPVTDQLDALKSITDSLEEF